MHVTPHGQHLDQPVQPAADQGERPRRPKQQPAPIHLEAGIVRGGLDDLGLFFFLIFALQKKLISKALEMV